MFHNFQTYTILLVNMAGSSSEINQRTKSQCAKKKVWCVFLKPIIMQYDLIFVIFTILLQTCPWQQCLPVSMNTIGYRTRYVCYIVVISAQVFSYPARSQIKIQQTCVQQYNFMFNVIFHVVLFTGDIHNRNELHVRC